MLSEILASYNLKQDEFEVYPFGNGLINKTWRLKNYDQDYILQRINTIVFKKPEFIASNVKLLADYLKNTNPDFLFNNPIKTSQNHEMAYIRGKGYYRLFYYVRQSHTINAAEKPQQANEAARKFGEFTKKLADFPITDLQITLPDFHNLSLRYLQFTEALKKGSSHRIKESKGVIDALEASSYIVKTYERILQDSSFKLRVTHHDTKISNVLFNQNDEGLCVIDLDTVMPGYFISDVGDMIRTYVSPTSEEEKDYSKIQIRDEYLKAIWNGYMSEMDEELTKEEKKHFVYAGKFMIYMQALRFLTDYLNNDIYYGANYEGHNLVRASNQVVLLQLLTEKEKNGILGVFH